MIQPICLHKYISGRLGGPAYQPNWEEVCSGEEEFHQELYSVEEDPEENSNLAREEELLEVVAQLGAS